METTVSGSHRYYYCGYSSFTEMYCHVYGSVYGLLEHCVQNLQLKTTARKSSHVNASHPSGGQNPSRGASEEQQHAVDAVYHPCHGPAYAQPADCNHHV